MGEALAGGASSVLGLGGGVLPLLKNEMISPEVVNLRRGEDDISGEEGDEDARPALFLLVVNGDRGRTLAIPFGGVADGFVGFRFGLGTALTKDLASPCKLFRLRVGQG